MRDAEPLWCLLRALWACLAFCYATTDSSAMVAWPLLAVAVWRFSAAAKALAQLGEQHA